MKYDARGKAGEPFPAPCRVIDAAGAVVPFARACDTETGEVVRYQVGDDGRFVLDEDNYAVLLAETRPAPLRVVPLGA